MGQLTGFVSRGECLRVTRGGKREHGTWPCRGITVEQQRENEREEEEEPPHVAKTSPSSLCHGWKVKCERQREEDTGGEAWLNWVREEARDFVSRREGTRGGLAPVICNPYARPPTTPLTVWDRDINRAESRGIAITGPIRSEIQLRTLYDRRQSSSSALMISRSCRACVPRSRVIINPYTRGRNRRFRS